MLFEDRLNPPGDGPDRIRLKQPGSPLERMDGPERRRQRRRIAILRIARVEKSIHDRQFDLYFLQESGKPFLPNIVHAGLPFFGYPTGG
jgi:hypothetical protein